MFKFTNLTVLFAVFVAHIFLIIVTFPMMAGIFIVAPGYFVMKMLILSHYAIVVEDIAVEGNDELPRPLRDLSWDGRPVGAVQAVHDFAVPLLRADRRGGLSAAGAAARDEAGDAGVGDDPVPRGVF
jgi:hypothetical protein